MPYSWSLVCLFFGPSASSLVHFKVCPEYLTRSIAQVSIPLIRFPLHSFVSSSFLVLLRYSFLIFSFISPCLIVSASKMPKYLYVSFSPSVLIFSWFGSSFPSVRCCLPLFITSMAIFLCRIPSLCPDWIRVSSSFNFLQIVWCHPWTLGDWSFLAIY